MSALGGLAVVDQVIGSAVEFGSGGTNLDRAPFDTDEQSPLAVQSMVSAMSNADVPLPLVGLEVGSQRPPPPEQLPLFA